MQDNNNAYSQAFLRDKFFPINDFNASEVEEVRMKYHLLNEEEEGQ